MGSAKILQEYGAGQYQVELIHDIPRITARVETLENNITSIESIIAAVSDAITAKQLEIDAKKDAINTAIATHENPETIQALQKELLALMGEKQVLVNRKNNLKAQLSGLQTSLTTYQEAETETIQKDVWCADKTTGLAIDQVVGTCDINGETSQTVITPGGVNTPAIDGKYQPALGNTAAGAFFNLAMLPGWQKWMPTYRIAKIMEITGGDTCTILVRNDRSSQQSLDINNQLLFFKVPIVYMSCDSSCFIAGDQVIVQFVGQDYTKPKVVGFESSPRSCFFTYDWYEVLPFGEPYYAGDMEGLCYLGDGKVLLGIGRFLMLSEDSGETWSELWNFQTDWPEYPAYDIKDINFNETGIFIGINKYTFYGDFIEIYKIDSIGEDPYLVYGLTGDFYYLISKRDTFFGDNTTIIFKCFRHDYTDDIYYSFFLVSNDGGDTWEVRSHPENINAGNWVGATSVICVGTGIYLASIVKGHQPGVIIRSTDYGASWMIVKDEVNEYKFLENIGGGIALCSNGATGILKTVDYGASWAYINLTGLQSPLCYLSGNYLFSGGYVKGINYSNDLGVSFNTIGVTDSAVKQIIKCGGAAALAIDFGAKLFKTLL